MAAPTRKNSTRVHHSSAITPQQLQAVLSVLNQWSTDIRDAGLVSGVYLYGSLLREQTFLPGKSDIDLLVELPPASTPEHRLQLLTALKGEGDRLEALLRGAFNAVRLVGRLVGICTATAYELENGIHFARNASNAFAALAFRPLPAPIDDDGIASERTVVSVGNRLTHEFLEVGFPAWNVISYYQGLRNDYLAGLIKLEKRIRSSWPSKEIARGAYDLLRLRNDSGQAEDYGRDAVVMGTVEAGKLVADKVHQSHSGLVQLVDPNKRGLVDYLSRHDLLMWDLLSREAQAIAGDLIGKKAMAAMRGANTAFFRELLDARATTHLAIDNSLRLVALPGLALADGWPCEILRSDAPMEPNYAFDEFDFDNLARIAAEWPDDIRRKLLDTARNDCDDGRAEFVSKTKIAFCGIDLSQIEVQTERMPKLSVRPLSYWIVRSLNFQIAMRPTDEQLQALRRRYLKNLAQSGSHEYRWNWPSQMFVELVVILSDGWVPKLEKLGSPMAVKAGAPVYTCGPELGLDWEKDLKRTAGGAHMLDIQAAARRAVQQELGASLTIADLSFFSLAIQQAHLNTGILGCVWLDQTRFRFAEIFEETRLRREQDGVRAFGEGVTFISPDAIGEEVAKGKDTNKWHQSALMRLNFARDARRKTD